VNSNNITESLIFLIGYDIIKNTEIMLLVINAISFRLVHEHKNINSSKFRKNEMFEFFLKTAKLLLQLKLSFILLHFKIS